MQMRFVIRPYAIRRAGFWLALLIVVIGAALALDRGWPPSIQRAQRT